MTILELGMTLLDDAVQTVKKFAPNFFPKMGIILGSGLGEIADQLVDPINIPFQAIPGLTASGVSGHASTLVLGKLNGVPVMCFKGRLHLYEGTSIDSLRILVRLIKLMGASSLVITGAAGSLNGDVGPGELMLINDHINLHPGNPLAGPNEDAIGPRFVSLENAYDATLNSCLASAAQKLGISMATGTYLSVLGPSFETPAEIRAFKLLGADAIGMSVVPEVIIARHCGLRVVAIAAITNLAVGMSSEKVTHNVTLENSGATAKKLIKLIPAFINEAMPVLAAGVI
jgi:xanthosine phosphorylase